MVSILTYGCECWVFDSKAHTRLQAWNSRRLAAVTGQGYREAYLEPAVNVVAWVRRQRLKWAGQLLRAPLESIPRRIMIGDWLAEGRATEGSLLVDAPKMDLVGLEMLAQDIVTWKMICEIH